jgi:hypothetical protein
MTYFWESAESSVLGTSNPTGIHSLYTVYVIYTVYIYMCTVPTVLIKCAGTTGRVDKQTVKFLASHSFIVKKVMVQQVPVRYGTIIGTYLAS